MLASYKTRQTQHEEVRRNFMEHTQGLQGALVFSHLIKGSIPLRKRIAEEVFPNELCFFAEIDLLCFAEVQNIQDLNLLLLPALSCYDNWFLLV